MVQSFFQGEPTWQGWQGWQQQNGDCKSGVQVNALSFNSTNWAPYDFNIRITSLCAPLTATTSGVRPSLFFDSTSTLPVSSSNRTTASCPFSAAYDSGVLPYLSFESISTWPVLSSSCTTTSCPFSAAHDSGFGYLYPSNRHRPDQF